MQIVTRQFCIKFDPIKKEENEMSTAGAEPSLTRRDLETALIEKCWKDPEFRKQVVSDPKGMLERHTGQRLPSEVMIFIHEEDANTLHFSIPLPPANVTELSDDELERVAGGTDVVVTVAAATFIAGVSLTGTWATAIYSSGKGW
jgi:Nitrile hydratase, alpha chain